MQEIVYYIEEMPDRSLKFVQHLCYAHTYKAAGARGIKPFRLPFFCHDLYGAAVSRGLKPFFKYDEDVNGAIKMHAGLPRGRLAKQTACVFTDSGGYK